MNRIIAFIFILSTSFSYAQVNTAPLEVPWIVSFGVNIVDNDGFRFDQPFDTDHWNFKNPISVSLERKWSPLYAAKLGISVNTLEKTNLHNNGRLVEDETLFSVDGSVRYFYDQHFMNTPRIDPFEAYVLSGLGYTVAGTHNTATFNLGLGFNFWIITDFGIRLQTMGKWGFKEWNYLKNYIQHSAEVIIRF